MNSTFSTSVFLLLIVAVPLGFDLSLIFTWPVGVVSLFITILLNTQPALNLKDARANRSTDRNTVLLIVLTCSLGLVLSILDWAYLRRAPTNLDTWSMLGLSLICGGFCLRLWAIRILKDAFSPTVQIKKNQELITDGPFRWLRHPSYTGAWISLTGLAMVLHSAIGWSILGVAMLWVYQKRIETEEKILKVAFGRKYTLYMQVTWRMFPGW